MNTQAEALHERTEVLLDEWRDFVLECEAGYGWNVYEYHNDLSVRDRLETCLHEMEPGDAAQVAEIDDRFRALLQPGVQVGPEDGPWWHRGVLRYAGPDMAAELKDWFRVDVEVRQPQT
ncbi:MAG TPA: hypothetical protein VGC13_07175 [Longimicrobium sp.]|jgi:hypothetical protein|uniref:hypothetical protein n=1 Tax=Longimicrobium sp. TaxID=2029185 RepID=UPI002ED7FEF5